MSVEAFIITNGRSTFKYALRSVKSQSIDVKHTVIKDMKWVDALNKCVELCEADWFIRVDDDMFLHPNCVEYMVGRIEKHNRTAAYSCKLFEDWTHTIAGSIKLYNLALVKRMGGFKINKLGKVDKPFSHKARKIGRPVVKDTSVVGVHGCGSWKEQKKYRALWLSKNSKVFYKEPPAYLLAQKTYRKSPEEQFLLIKKLMSKNRRRKTRFFKFLKQKKIQEKRRKKSA